MATAYSYIRFSSKGKQELGDSVKRQTRLRNSWLDRNPDHELDDTIRLHDLGTSAFRGRNLDKDKGSLGAFIELVKQGRIERGSILLLERLDRFSRQPPSKAYRVFCELVELGIVVQTLDPEMMIDTNNIDSMETIIPTIVYMQLAYEQSREKSQRVGHAWKSKREAAKENNTPMFKRCPSWLKWEEEKQDFVATREGKRVVRYIFKRTQEKCGQRRLVEELNKKFKPLIETKNPDKPRSYNSSFVQKVLSDRAVLGELQPHKFLENGDRVPDGPPLEGYYPRIIADELFYECQAVKKSRAKRKGPTGDFVNLFRGLVWFPDGHKGHLQTTRSKLKNGKPYVQKRFVSYGWMRRLPDSCSITIDYHKFEDIVLAVLNNITPADLQPPTTPTISTDLATLELTMEGIDNRLAELDDALDHGKAVVEIMSAIERLKEKRSTITKQIENLKAQNTIGFDDPLKDAQSVIAFLSTKTKREKRKLRLKLQSLLGHVIERIDVFPTKEKRVKFSTTIELKNGTSIRIDEGVDFSKWHENIPPRLTIGKPKTVEYVGVGEMIGVGIEYKG